MYVGLRNPATEKTTSLGDLVHRPAARILEKDNDNRCLNRVKSRGALIGA